MNAILSRLIPLATMLMPWALPASEMTLPLDGTWKFQLDPKNAGMEEKWFTRELEDSIRLPGTTDENHKGIQQDERPTDRLMRPWFWKGPAWYQREVRIPESWKGKRITLFLERTKNSRAWVNGTFVGRENSLSAPHVFDVTQTMKPGKQTITVLIDNSKLPPVGPSHQVDERTQTNWNGILGRMELRATDPVWIKDAQVYPNAAKKEARVRVVVGNITGQAAEGTLAVTCSHKSSVKTIDLAAHRVKVNAGGAESVVEFIYQPGDAVPLWDEFSPVLLDMSLKLETAANGTRFHDTHSLSFGMRDFSAKRNLLQVNGTTIFLRGRLDCANYPLTGYAPMDKAEWMRIYGILREWGLNHVRFHSWCPPKAAFEAADELGFYLQVELPNKRSAFNAEDSKEAAHHNIDFLEGENMDESMALYDYGKREGELILRQFGNHPSFVMFTLGNELGRSEGMFELVGHFKKLDPRRLYAQGSNNMHWNPSLAAGDEFWVTGKVGNDTLPIRGSFYIHDFDKGAIEFNPPGTLDDFTDSIQGVPVPLIGHETGQFQVYPDFRDIPKFTGVLKARNYEIFRERLEKAGMLDQSHDFVRASGALAAICYREDIELALRTPGFGGFQLLDIMDFPGQGTALVGLLNVFMESKGVIGPVQWREFCAPTVPLLRVEKLTWTAGELFTGDVQIAHYGPADIPDATLKGTLKDHTGKVLAAMTCPPVSIKRGGITSAGKWTLPFESLKNAWPQKLTLTLSMDGTDIHNSYPVWVYPGQVDTRPGNVLVSNNFTDAETKTRLAAGGKVLLLPKPENLPHSVPGGFQCEFWSPMFAQSARKRGIQEPPGTLGILCDPKHPALARFPTEFHSNWQWWHLVKNSRPIAYDGTPNDFRPTVQVIDNFDRNHKLGLIAETRVGKGSMLICAIDLQAHQDKPEARQMLHSLLRYMDSPDFAPKHELDAGLLTKLLPE